ncbi:superoxide dismutase [Nonomuraea sp. WAC 01424]|uniref:superoxide dismutase family protein n=1 Tax=Nonomuraea sp. WAC 01424 TaxID=2203200 RepID=UPI000F791A8D|nr:superoxide dismutase family protein [Nonomuraea sp. WAC 01424]RSN07471.1 superoxide dismutase [Nonomuraea sp. WAC 01424]
MRAPALLLVLLTTAACTGPPAPLQQVTKPSPAGAVALSGAGEFGSDDTAAIAYDRRLAPAGALASLTAESAGGTTRTSLVVEGFLPNRHYGAHLHTATCGTDPDDAGGHYQHDPGHADPASEVWLDVATDGSGAGRSTARHSWSLDPAALPKSLVIHAKATTKSGAHAGEAGPRVACLTLH